MVKNSWASCIFDGHRLHFQHYLAVELKIQLPYFMKSLRKLLKRTYKKVLHSIAFYPVLISIVFCCLAFISLSAEGLQVINALKSKIPALFIEDYETARVILATLFGGILSLTVFSFTMVMVVLGQASSNFSPRLLPGLISNKRHQIILGWYIGTLTYVMIILISLGAYGLDRGKLGLSTMLAALFGVICVGLFVYFIHSISSAIQIHHIIERIFKESDRLLNKTLNDQKDGQRIEVLEDSSKWSTIQLDKSGYYQEFDPSLLSPDFPRTGLQIEIAPYANKHVWQGEIIFRYEGNLSDSDRESLLFCLNIASDRHEESTALGGMIKLMEVAVKALSPGINDPGTAIDVINRIALLMRKILRIHPKTMLVSEDSQLKVIENHILADEIIRVVVQPIRYYSSNDMAVQYELVSALQFVHNDPEITALNRKLISAELDHMSLMLQKKQGDPDRNVVLELIHDH